MNSFVVKRGDYDGYLDGEIECEVKNRDHCGWSLLQELKDK